MKKRLLKFITGFLLVFIFSTVCYYVSFQGLIKRYRNEGSDDFSIDQNLKDYLYMDEEHKEDTFDEQATVTTDTEQQIIVKPDTIFYLETYDSKAEQFTTETQTLPPEFVGLNRTALIAYLEEYMDNIPIKEYQNGLIAYELLAFSDDSITLRKTYNTSFNTNTFFVTLRNDSIIVYYSDLKSVYEYTGISSEALSDEARDTLVTGIYVKDVEELYDVLSAYTS